MIKKLIGIVILFLSIQTACTIRQEFYFNEDLSGKANSQFDLSIFNSVIQFVDTTGNTQSYKDTIAFYFAEIAQKMKAIQGISDVKYGWDTDGNNILISYNFATIEALNSALNSSSYYNPASPSFTENAQAAHFEKKGNKLIYHIPRVNSDTLFSSPEMAKIKESYKYQLKIGFTKPIKKIYDKNLTVSADKKSIEKEGNLFDFVSGKKDTKIVLKIQ